MKASKLIRKILVESFLLFARDIPSQNLGFIDASASTVEVSVHGHEFSIMQSPGVLASRRAGGTTGAGTVVTLSGPSL